MKTFSRFAIAVIVALAVGSALWTGPAEAVKVWDFSVGAYIVPGWFVNPYSPLGETVITVDGSDPKNFEIKVGVSSFGSVQTDTQTSAIYGAGAYLPGSPSGYRVEFSTQVYGWDSYDVIGYPAPGGTGYWDVFAVNLNNTGYYWTLVNGGTGGTGDPIVTPDPAGSCVDSTGVNPGCVAGASNIAGVTWAWGALDYANNTFEGNAGSYTLTLTGSAASYYLSVVLDTRTTPNADASYPSFGAFNPLSEVTPPTLVPEPGTLFLLGSGLLGAAGWARRRRAQRNEGGAMKIKPLVSALCLLAVGAFTAPPAWALATATSEATIDWNSLNITLGSGMGINWIGTGSGSEAWAYHNLALMNNQGNSSSGWGDTSATATYSTSNGSATGTASTTANTLQASTNVSSDLGGGRFDASAAYWGENRWGNFIVYGGSGIVSFSVNYSVSLTLNQTLPQPQEMTTANPASGLYLKNLIGGGSMNVVKEIWYPGWDPPLNGTLSDSGILTVSLSFAEGEKGYLAASVSAGSGASSVPEPGTLLLLGSGLLGAGAWARRRA